MNPQRYPSGHIFLTFSQIREIPNFYLCASNSKTADFVREVKMDSDLVQDLEDICYYFDSSFFKLCHDNTHSSFLGFVYFLCL